MTHKEAILKSLDELKQPTSHNDVFNHIKANNYCDFSGAKTPHSSISAALGSFIREGDKRVKRFKRKGGGFLYYLSKNENDIESDILTKSVDTDSDNTNEKAKKRKPTSNSFLEKDLHILLSSYLKNLNVYSKTISHEHSKNSRDNNQVWTHPDMIGIKFIDLNNIISKNFLKSINRIDTFKLSSYEIKKEINSDADLKKAYFQSVSNSSWANYGYLVAFQLSDSLYDEMERLNQSFGIGIINIHSNPYTSKVLFPARYRELDIKTIDKLCVNNEIFAKFIEFVDKLMAADEKYYDFTESVFSRYCDKYFLKDSEVESYCKGKNIDYEDINN